LDEHCPSEEDRNDGADENRAQKQVELGHGSCSNQAYRRSWSGWEVWWVVRCPSILYL
jgi:hypothetical protein